LHEASLSSLPFSARCVAGDETSAKIFRSLTQAEPNSSAVVTSRKLSSKIRSNFQVWAAKVNLLAMDRAIS